MWYRNKFFEKIVAVILVLLAIYLGYSLSPIIGQIMHFIIQVLFPVFLSAILYYLLRPLVQWLEKRIGIYLAITTAFLITGSLFLVLGIFIYPAIVAQVHLFQSINLQDVSNLQHKGNNIFASFDRLGSYFGEEIRKVISSTLSYLHVLIVENITVFITVMTQFVFTLIMVPFLLFYLLKDGKKIHEKFLYLVPVKYYSYVKNMLVDCDQALLQFINGRVVIAAITATLLYICFLFIGIDYLIVLTLISFVFYIIPTIGNFLAMILPLIVGFSMSAVIGLEVLIAMLVISSLEGFFISTLVMGATLYVHPITLLLILTAAGAFYGVFGLLFAAPAYVIGKIIVTHSMQFYKEQRNKETQ